MNGLGRLRLGPARFRPRPAFAILVAALSTHAAGDDAGSAALRRRGVAALPVVLAQVDAADPDARLRARRLAKLIVVDHFRAQTPPGMQLLLGRLVVTRDGVNVERGLYLAKHEVTLGEFRRFCTKTGRSADRWGAGAEALPVTSASLLEARAYAQAMKARLPTLVELEWAATSGGRFLYPWGDRFDPARVNSREGGRGRPEPVGSRRGGLSTHGVADLRGNVAEWTETATGRSAALRYRVVGGSFRGFARKARFTTYTLEASARLDDVGFRLAKSLPALPPGVGPDGS